METIFVKDLMVPLEGYATVPQEATLREAVLALEKAQMALDPSLVTAEYGHCQCRNQHSPKPPSRPEGGHNGNLKCGANFIPDAIIIGAF